MILLLIVAVPLGVAGLLYGARHAQPTSRSGPLRPLTPLLWGMAGAAGIVGLLFGTGDGFYMGLLLITAVGFGAVALVASRRDAAGAGDSWTGPSATAHHPPLAHGRGVAPPTVRSVALSVGRVEMRELSRSPWFGVGFGFSVLMVVLFGVVWGADNTEAWEAQLQLSSWFAYPPVGMAILAMHRAATRAARDGADEMFDVCPTAPSTRTLGMLAVGIVPVALVAALVPAIALATLASGGEFLGPIGADGVAEVAVAAAAVLGAGGVALGVALGRWIHFGLAPVVAVVAIGILGVRLNVLGGRWGPLAPLSTAPAVHDRPPMFGERPEWWHLLWVVGLAAIVAVLAVARHRRDRWVAWTAAAAVFVSVVAGVGATRPLSPSAATRIATAIGQPESAQECSSIRSVEICLYPLYRPLLGRFVTRLAPIASVLPPEIGPVTLRQVYEGDLDKLPPPVRSMLGSEKLDRPATELAVGYHREDIVRAGDDLAHLAVGLPLEPGDDRLPLVVAGQARGVLAIWLGTRGLDPNATARASTSRTATSPDAFERGSLGPDDDPCYVAPVVWSTQDLTAARAIIALPERSVARVVAKDWPHWTDPDVSTDDLLAALGLDPVGPFDNVVPRASESPC